ncbi:class I SAM-dependent methyltransferase [Mucilaginibacter flavus]|uniref:class I SAM-dependent methyltransferase n=1 Tax=Mucilaginibacter flavus TaxID=931504 RepID=UPI0025B37148|nr:class I SAM-dependent methyltransferase [Mucilaginibacter flavus]MDN3579615.1 class I SAM-dependent methyltransferase [Mucilaginibacter flavus]
MQDSIIGGDYKTAYDQFYQKHDEAWRMLGAKYKAQHIIDVCKGLTFNKVLEVGAGDGSILKILSDHDFAPEYNAVEISESGVQYIQSRAIKNLKSVQVFDGYKLPFEDDSFDLIILSHVLEHVEHERILLREIKRVAKRCVIEVPRDYKTGVDTRIKHFLAYGHINVYTPTSLRYLLSTEGFVVENDLTSMIEPEVTKFNSYVNQKKAKSVLKDLRIAVEFGIKQVLSKVMGKKVSEQFANAYTVLCNKAEKQPELF